MLDFENNKIIDDQNSNIDMADVVDLRTVHLNNKRNDDVGNVPTIVKTNDPYVKIISTILTSDSSSFVVFKPLIVTYYDWSHEFTEFYSQFK